MTPLEWVALPLYLLTPLLFVFFGNGDLRKKDERYLAHLQAYMFIPGVWALVVSWFALATLVGVAGFLFWRDASAATLYEHTLGLWWANLVVLMIWMRLAKLQYNTAAFFFILATVATAIAAVVLMGISASWAAFGCYLVYTVFVTLFMVWAGRVAFSAEIPIFKVKVEVDVGGKPGYEQVPAQPTQAQAQAQIQSQMRSQFSAVGSAINVAALRVP